MSLWSRLYRGETQFDFISERRRYFLISSVLILVSAVSLLFRGLDGSVDFTGGTIIEAENRAGADDGEVLAALEGFGLGGVRVQFIGTDRVRVQTESIAAEEQDALVMAVADVVGVPFDETNVDAVGPTFGAEITSRAITALIWFLIVVAAFIAIRFEAKMSVAAIAALFHDLIITAGIYSIVGFQVTPATVIAVLTILGYSLYDTVVVFDKITENVRELSGRHTFTEIANLSMNQVLMRSINTLADVAAAHRQSPVHRVVPARCDDAPRVRPGSVHRCGSGNLFVDLRGDAAAHAVEGEGAGVGAHAAKGSPARHPRPDHGGGDRGGDGPGAARYRCRGPAAQETKEAAVDSTGARSRFQAFYP